MNDINIVYFENKCLALRIQKDYMSQAFYYTSEDKIIPKENQNVEVLDGFAIGHSYREDYWHRNLDEDRKEYVLAKQLSENMQIVYDKKSDNLLHIKMTDPNYREVLIKAKQEAERASKRSATTNTYYGRTNKRQQESQMTIPDPDDPKSLDIFVTAGNYWGEIKKTCICKSSDCRHVMAVAEFIFSEKRKLKDAYIRSENTEDKSFFISEKLSNMIDDCIDEGPKYISPSRISQLKAIADEIKSVNSQSYFDAVLNYVIVSNSYGYYDAKKLEKCEPLIGMFFLDPVLNKWLGEPDRLDKLIGPYYDRQNKSNVVTFKRELKNFQKAEKDLEKGKQDDSSFKRLIIKYSLDPEKILKFYAETAEVLNEDDLEFLNLYSQEYKLLENDIKYRILEKVDRTYDAPYDKRDLTIFILLQAFTPEEQAVRLSKMKNYSLDLGTYRNLSQELKEQLAEDMNPDTENLDYILNTVTAQYDDARKARLILKMAKKLEPGRYSNKREEAKLLVAAAEKLKNNKILLLYLISRFVLENCIPENNSIQIKDEDVTSYFFPDFIVSDDNGEVRTDYFLFEGTESPIGEIKGYVTTQEIIDRYRYGSILQFSEKNNAITCISSPGKYLSLDSIKCIADLALNDRKDECMIKRHEMQDEINARNFEKNHKHFATKYKELCQGLQEEKVLLNDTYKARLNYLFEISDDKVHLGFKVGNTKYYIVKNAADFIGAFRTGETISYGKDLVLTHDINNLNDEDQPVVRLLSSLRLRTTGSGPLAKRTLPVPGAAFSNIIELLKDRNVWFGEDETLVRLNPVTIKLRINRNYELGVDYDETTQKIISAGNSSYILTKNTEGIATIDYINADTSYLRLIDFVLDNGGVSIRPIINDFKRNVYSRFYDSFIVEDEVRKDFKLSTVSINAYFDYADRNITLKTELLKNDHTLEKKALTERIDISKVENFEKSMEDLGFEDDVLADEGKILSFLKMDFTNLKRQASIYLSESLSNKKLVSLNQQTIRVSYSKSGLIDAVLEKSDYTEEELAEMLQAMKRKKKFILLSDNRIIDLDSAEAKEFRDAVNDLGLETGHLYKKKRLNMVEALKAFAHEKNCSLDKHLRTVVDEVRSFKDYDIKLPKLNYDMRAYQEEGYRWMSVLSKYNLGGILADDMGLGKTLQIIALIKADKTSKPSLIVCPKSLVFNWINEFAKFDGETTVTEVYGLPDKREEIIRGIDYKSKTVYVTSYDSLRNDIDYYDGKFNYCVLDEAQYIKNVTALKSKSVKEIKADHRFALTGTPIENNIIDLWSIFDFIMPGYLEELSVFKSSADQEEFHEKVSKRVGMFVLRRIKENVLAELPSKYEKIMSCEMTPTQRKSYEAIRKKARDAMSENGKAFDLLPYLTKMRQVCIDPAMCVDDYGGGSGKLDMLNELIPQYLEEGHRILIFSQFVKGLNQIEKLLNDKEIGYYLLTGDTSAKERSRMIDEFNSTVGTDIFLISLKAGGTGLNLTGADTVIHLDPWWNVAAENQATDRAHRIGQTKNVEVIKLISENSIEQRVIELQNLKKDLIDRVISDDESSVTGARIEDIAYILE